MQKSKKGITHLHLALIVAVIVIVIVGSVAYIWTRPPPGEEEEKVLVVGSTEYYRNPDIDIGYMGLDAFDAHLRSEKLFYPDPSEPGAYLPQIAESWELKNATGAAYIDFKIREGLKFQDGVSITADTVKWSWEREPKVDEHHVWWHKTAYRELVVLDDYTLRMYLNDPYFIPHTMAALMLLHHGFIKSPGAGENATGIDVVGSGPYKLVEYIPNERLVYEKWEDYPDIPGAIGHPGYADKIIIRMFAESSSMRIALEKGEIDIVLKDFTKPDLKALIDNPDVTIETTPSGYTRYLAMNWAVDPFNDVRVRRAIAYALNPKEIMDATQLGLAELAKSPVHSWMSYYIPYFDEVYDQSSSNVEKAKALLAEAGYPDGFSTELWYSDHYESYVTEGQVATVIQSQLAEVGITVALKQVEWGLYVDKVKSMAIPGMGLGGWKWDYPDPDTDLTYCITYENGTGRGYTEWGYKNLTADSLFFEGQRLYDPTIPPEQNTERKEIYEKLQKIYTQDVVAVPLYFPVEFTACRKDVKGHHIFYSTYWKLLWNAYKDEWGITPKPEWDIFHELLSSTASSTPFESMVIMLPSLSNHLLSNAERKLKLQ